MKEDYFFGSEERLIKSKILINFTANERIPFHLEEPQVMPCGGLNKGLQLVVGITLLLNA